MSVQQVPAGFNAEEADNFEDIEKQFAVKAVQHMTTYWAILEKVKGSSLRLTKLDDEIYEHLKTDFPEFDPAATIDEDEMKSKAGKERWRNFMMKYEKKVDDYNFGTMLRSNPKWEYGEKETIFGALRCLNGNDSELTSFAQQSQECSSMRSRLRETDWASTTGSTSKRKRSRRNRMIYPWWDILNALLDEKKDLSTYGAQHGHVENTLQSSVDDICFMWSRTRVQVDSAFDRPIILGAQSKYIISGRNIVTVFHNSLIQKPYHPMFVPESTLQPELEPRVIVLSSTKHHAFRSDGVVLLEGPLLLIVLG